MENRTLIQTMDELREHVAVNVNNDLELLLPDLDLVQDQDLRPLLGDAFLQELLAKKAAGTLGPVLMEVVRYLQSGLVNLALAENLPLAQVQVSDSGVHISSTGDKKTAFQWQVNELRAAWVRKGFNFLERALDVLDQHLDDASVATWATSEAGTRSHQYFVNTAAQFSAHYNIGRSRLVYLALLPTLAKVERFSLEPVLGLDFYLELKEQVKDRDVTVDNQQLLDLFVRPALTNLTVAKAVPEIGLSLNGSALELNVYRFDDTERQQSDSRPGAPLVDLLQQKVRAAVEDGHVYLQRLRAYLNANASATRFATYFTSAVYQPAGPRPVVRNDQASAAYGAF
ncbi:DUF6712 family protein [Hymenobacter rubidus]|uniref:DUF6712 family protein n=1 Tax=Hymenobacter rubidus TaxID=1441626 RepID=UPI00191F2E37|nr:DUF6712 family protein [Hymenobacter rubidus]